MYRLRQLYIITLQTYVRSGIECNKSKSQYKSTKWNMRNRMTGNKCALLIFKSINTRSKHNGSFQKIKRKLLKSDFCVFFESIRFDNDIDPARIFLNCALPAPRTIELVKLRKPNSNPWVTIFYKVNSNFIFPSWLLIYMDQPTLNTVISGIEASLLFNFGLLEQSCIRV